MIQAIDYDGSNHQLVTGVPGSGKTTVTIMRAERLINSDKKILVLTFQNLLCVSLKNIAQTEALRNCIFGLYDWYPPRFGWLDDTHSAEYMIGRMHNLAQYDEILIDEGQDFEARVYQAFLTKCRRMTVGADNAQRVHERGILAPAIRVELENSRNTVPIPLQYNYRNTFEIYNFARYFMPDNERANNPIALQLMPRGTGNMPVIIQALSDEEKFNRLRVILENAGDVNIAILLYGQREVDYHYQRITQMGFSATKWYHGHQPTDIENILVTTYKSAKGLEFQVVIMPDMHTAMNSEEKTAEHYYIGCTRAKESLFLTFTGTNLPDYFEDFADNSYEFRQSEYRAQRIPPQNITLDDLPF
ncbi:ATP-binding domain-containing protein [Niabella insulamsoli]|uniref:ATP-binding domain-containing protein n=1 Tax=Niabella insulamsoli TaxID=3144874 RepID=UPI003D0B179E